jgi:hypothetical protein
MNEADPICCPARLSEGRSQPCLLSTRAISRAAVGAPDVFTGISRTFGAM